MKRLLVFFSALLMSSAIWSQDVLTVVHAESDDGFVNVRAQPSSKAKVLTQMYGMFHGLGRGVLLGKKGNWCKVYIDGITGWAYSKYVGTQDWYYGDGRPKLVAVSQPTILYGDNYTDDEGEMPVFGKVNKGTILADSFEEKEDYYVLLTAHDYIYIRKKDAKVVK